MNINQKNHLSFGQLIIRPIQGKSNITRDSLPKTPNSQEECFAVDIIRAHANNKTVQNLDKNGIDVHYEIYLGKNKDNFITNHISRINLIDKRTNTLMNDKDTLAVKPHMNYKFNKDHEDWVEVDTLRKITDEAIKTFPATVEELACETDLD